MPPRNNNLLQLVNNGVQRPARPDRSISSDNTNVETPRQYQGRQVQTQENLRTMATIEAGRQITGNPDLPPDAAINAYNRAVAISQMRPDQLNDVNKLYPAGNPWTFSDNIRRALGYYTVAERDLAARLNQARSASFFGGVTPDFGPQWAWLHPQAEYDAFRQTALYLPNALLMGATLGNSPGLVTTFGRGFGTGMNAARTAGANILRGIGSGLWRGATAVGNAANAENLLRLGTAAAFTAAPFTAAAQEQSDNSDSNFFIDFVTEHPWMTAFMSLPVIGGAGKVGLWTYDKLKGVSGAPIRRWLNNRWYNNIFNKDGKRYRRYGTPTRDTQYDINQYVANPDLLTPYGRENYPYPLPEPPSADALFLPKGLMSENVDFAKRVSGAADDTAARTVLSESPRYANISQEIDGLELSSQRAALEAAKQDLSRVQQLQSDIEGLIQTANSTTDADVYVQSWNDINRLLKTTNIDNEQQARNKIEELVRNAENNVATAQSAYDQLAAPILEQARTTLEQGRTQAQGILDFYNNFTTNYNKGLNDWEQFHSRWGTASKRLFTTGVLGTAATILGNIFSGGDDNSSNSTDKPDKQTSESQRQNTLSKASLDTVTPSSDNDFEWK